MTHISVSLITVSAIYFDGVNNAGQDNDLEFN